MEEPYSGPFPGYELLECVSGYDSVLVFLFVLANIYRKRWAVTLGFVNKLKRETTLEIDVEFPRAL